jgi:hypothetical protein
MPSQRTVDVRDGQLVIGTDRRLDLIGHLYTRRGDRELVRDLATRLAEIERGGA